ncbi:MAG: hypothetical protein M3014_15035 [Chloroflexota bacterium]|nr:hypothetical protein [Chloroflexota bacterium]
MASPIQTVDAPAERLAEWVGGAVAYGRATTGTADSTNGTMDQKRLARAIASSGILTT